MVSCCAPQTGRSQIEKEEFWRQVEGVVMNIDINQEVIVSGKSCHGLVVMSCDSHLRGHGF